MFFVIHPLSFPFPQLVSQFVDDLINGRVKITVGLLAVNVRPGHTQVNFNYKTFGGRLGFIVPQNHVGTHDIVREMLQMRDFFCYKSMECSGQFQMPWTDVYLHII